MLHIFFSNKTVVVFVRLRNQEIFNLEGTTFHFTEHYLSKLSLFSYTKTLLDSLCSTYSVSSSVVVTFCLSWLLCTPTNYCAKLLFFSLLTLKLSLKKQTNKKKNFEIPHNVFLELSSVGLRSKACRVLRSLLVCLLFCCWFKLKSSLICHEPGREPAEVSRQGDGSPMLLFITKHGQNTTCFSVSQNWEENQLKGENHICQAHGRHGSSSVFVVDLL